MIPPEADFLAGYHSVAEALRAGRRRFYRLYVTTSPTRRWTKLQGLACKRGVAIETVTAAWLADKTATNRHQGIGAAVSPWLWSTLEECLDTDARRDRPAFWLLLDGIVDPGNLGALLRSALAVGVSAVVLPKDRSAGPSPTVSRASAGALEHSRLARVTNMTTTIKHLQQRGMWIYGLDRGAAQTIYNTDLTEPVALVVGGEEKGIRPRVRKACDALVSIPQAAGLDSLNASVAGAVAMYEIYRQKRYGRTI
jgi:23S rRNA (guanosine2251-2'-O)-methyltransferase